MRVSPRKSIERNKKRASTLGRVAQKRWSRAGLRQRGVAKTKGPSKYETSGGCRELLVAIRGEMGAYGRGGSKLGSAPNLRSAARDLLALGPGHQELLQALQEYLVQQRTLKAFSGSVIVG